VLPSRCRPVWISSGDSTARRGSVRTTIPRGLRR
jgi:hypothetical protein